MLKERKKCAKKKGKKEKESRLAKLNRKIDIGLTNEMEDPEGKKKKVGCLSFTVIADNLSSLPSSLYCFYF